MNGNIDELLKQISLGEDSNGGINIPGVDRLIRFDEQIAMNA